jgi:hypothetical protein
VYRKYTGTHPYLIKYLIKRLVVQLVVGANSESERPEMWAESTVPIQHCFHLLIDWLAGIRFFYLVGGHNTLQYIVVQPYSELLKGHVKEMFVRLFL